MCIFGILNVGAALQWNRAVARVVVAALVVLHDLVALWGGRHLSPGPEEWTLDDLPVLDCPVVEGHTPVQERKEKHGVDEHDATGHTEDAAEDLTGGPIIEIKRCS